MTCSSALVLIAMVLISLVLATLYVDDGFLKPRWLFGSWEPCPLHLAGALDKLPAILLLLSVARRTKTKKSVNASHLQYCRCGASPAPDRYVSRLAGLRQYSHLCRCNWSL